MSNSTIKQLRRYLAGALGFGVAAVAGAQSPAPTAVREQARSSATRGPSPDAQAAAMKKLGYMVGRWEGGGWIELRGGVRETFRGVELVQNKLDGIALLVEGRFVAKRGGTEAEVPIHVTLAVISWDERAQHYRINTWLASGASGEHELRLLADGWQWGLEFPGGSVRFTMSLTPEGEWLEIGERTMDGEKTWAKFFEMRLKPAR